MKLCRNGHSAERNKHGECRECRRANDRRWKNKNRELHNARNRAAYALASPEIKAKHCAKAAAARRTNPDRYRQVKYGLRPGQYFEMLAAQNNVCAICKKPCLTSKRLAVDHDHKCCSGKKACGRCVRGLLCYRCNHMLATAQDDPDLLTTASAYLKSMEYRR